MSNEDFWRNPGCQAGDDRGKHWETPEVEVIPIDDTAAYVVGDHVDAEWGDPFLS